MTWHLQDMSIGERLIVTMLIVIVILLLLFGIGMCTRDSESEGQQIAVEASKIL